MAIPGLGAEKKLLNAKLINAKMPACLGSLWQFPGAGMFAELFYSNAGKSQEDAVSAPVPDFTSLKSCLPANSREKTG